MVLKINPAKNVSRHRKLSEFYKEEKPEGLLIRMHHYIGRNRGRNL